MKRAERPFRALPLSLVLFFFVTLAMQIGIFQLSMFKSELEYKPLAEPFVSSTYRISAMGSDRLMSYLLAIRLQLHDNQSGKHIRYEQLDYKKLVSWLDQIDRLNIHSGYTAMLASRVYSQTADKKNIRLMIDFIQRSFVQNPQLNWRRMTEATILAKHKLDDLELALSLAAQLTKQPIEVVMPQWARDMKFLILGEMNEFEAGIAIIVMLLESDSVDEIDEQRFLEGKLLDFQQKLLESQQKSE
jgi:hypothetical protein